MRLALPRSRRGGMGLLSLIAAQLAAYPAFAGNAQLFPVSSHLVPAAVVAAFILPAAAAGCVWTMRRVTRSRVGLVGLGLVAGGAIAVLAYVNPAVLAGLRV